MVPAIIGAIGAIGGSAMQTMNAAADRRAQQNLANQKARRVQKGLETANATYADIEKQLDDYYANANKYTNANTVKEYQDLIANYNPEDYVLGEDQLQFNYDKSVDDFASPYMDQIISNAMGKVQSTAAGAGLGRSGGTASEMLDVGAETANDLYRTALSDYQNERNFAYQQYRDYISNMQNRLNTMANMTSNKINMLGGALQHDEQLQSDYMADILGIAQDKAQSNIQAGAWS